MSYCRWTTQGELVCLPDAIHAHPKTHVIEHFAPDMGYSFNVLIYDKNGNVIDKTYFTNRTLGSSAFIVQKRPTKYEQYGEAVRVEITDATMYTNPGRPYRPVPLQLLIELGKNSKPIPIIFSDKPGIDNAYYRTAELNIPAYEGFLLYFNVDKLRVRE